MKGDSCSGAGDPKEAPVIDLVGLGEELRPISLNTEEVER